MKAKQITTAAALLLGSCGALNAAQVLLPTVIYSDLRMQSPAPVASIALKAAASTLAAGIRETVSEIANESIPNIPGKRLVSVIVDYAPGASSAAHHHPRSAFIYAYVISGEIRSQVDDEPPRTYAQGEVWFEKPGAHHRVSANASATQPARLLAVFIVDADEAKLVVPNSK